MEKFVKLEIFDADGNRVWRTFNLRYVRSFDESTCRLQMNGSSKPILVERGSMVRLVEVATTDIEVMSGMISYLRGCLDGVRRKRGFWRWL